VSARDRRSQAAAEGVEGIAFDLYGTLLDVASVRGACAEVTPDPDAMAALWRQKQIEYTWLRALMGRYEDFSAVTAAALDHVADRLGLALDAGARNRLLQAWLELAPYPEVADALARLAPRPLAVLSNGDPAMLEAALAAAGLRGRFAYVLSVDAVRTYKPAPAVYALAERAFGRPRDRLLFVSANPWDAAGAAAFGLPTARLDRSGVPGERLGAEPVMVVADLAELAVRLEDR
jgi:2-haloacid dehalogenase